MLCKACRSSSNRRYFTTPSGRATHLLKGAKKRSKARGEPFGLSREWVLERVTRGHCEVTGLKFDLTPAVAYATTNPFAPSIDRIDSSKGYTPDNCQLVVWVHNAARMDFGDAAVRRYARALNRASINLTTRSDNETIP